MENNKKPVGVLWVKTSKAGTQYLSGKIGETEVVVFANSYKNADNQPDYKVYKSEKKSSNPSLENKAPSAKPTQPALGSFHSNNITEEDVPF